MKPDSPWKLFTGVSRLVKIGNCSKYCGFQATSSLEHGYLFFGDERVYPVMHAKDADKGGRSAIEEMPASLDLEI